MMAKRSSRSVSSYLVAGGSDKIQAIKKFLESAGMVTHANPDLYIREYVSFGVDDARELRGRANSRATVSARRVFVIITPSMTVDAQNALLKTLEEPPGDAMFFFVVAGPSTLLPTLLSRSQVLDLAETMPVPRLDIVDVEKFLAARLDERIEMLKPLYEKRDDDERDVQKSIQFLQGVERFLENGEGVGKAQGIRAVYLARKYILDRGALLKPLLEQVALSVTKL